MDKEKKINIIFTILIGLMAIVAIYILFKTVFGSHPSFDNFRFFVLMALLYTIVDVFLLMKSSEYKNKENTTIDKVSKVFNRIVQDLVIPLFLLLASFYLSKIS